MTRSKSPSTIPTGAKSVEFECGGSETLRYSAFHGQPSKVSDTNTASHAVGGVKGMAPSARLQSVFKGGGRL